MKPKYYEQSELNDLLSSWLIAYGELFYHFYPKRFHWLFEQNPMLRDLNEIIIVKDKTKIVSWVCNMRISCFVENRLLNSAFTINTFTLYEYRRQGLGSEINKFNSDNNNFLWSVSMSDSNRNNRIKLGWLKGQPQYQLIGRIGSFDNNLLYVTLDKFLNKKKYKYFTKFWNYFKFNKLKYILGFFADFVIPKKTRINLFDSSLKYDKIDSYDEFWDNFWFELRKEYNYGTDRSSMYMNWKYKLQPEVNFSKYMIYQDGILIGTVVFRKSEKMETPHAIITEILLKKEFSNHLMKLLILQVGS